MVDSHVAILGTRLDDATESLLIVPRGVLEIAEEGNNA
jgi:hypothetical protein